MREPLIGFATAITSKFPDSFNWGGRVIPTICIFILSGLVHGFNDFIYWTTAEVHTLPVLQFFSACSVAVTLETLVVSRYRAYRTKLGWSAESLGPWERMIGYVWVLFFFSYVTPSLFYPAARILETENKRLLL
jgi:hypothetical protein